MFNTVEGKYPWKLNLNETKANFEIKKECEGKCVKPNGTGMNSNFHKSPTLF